MAKTALCRRCRRFFHQHVVPVLHSPMSYNVLRSYPLSPHPPHLGLKRNDITSLPRTDFRGRKIVVYGDEMKYSRQILQLARNDVLGFDTESPQCTQCPSLVQLASNNMCIMWKLRWKKKREGKFPPLLHSILTSPQVLKVGSDSKDDVFKLLKYFHVNTRNFFDTIGLAEQLRFTMKGLQGIIAVFLGCRLNKSSAMQRSNWGNKELSPQQVKYASTDAWASLQAYVELIQYAAKEGITPQPPTQEAFELTSFLKQKDTVQHLMKCQAQELATALTAVSHKKNRAPCRNTPREIKIYAPSRNSSGSSHTPCELKMGSSGVVEAVVQLSERKKARKKEEAIQSNRNC